MKTEKSVSTLSINVNVVQSGENWNLSQSIISHLLFLPQDLRIGIVTFPDFSVGEKTYRFSVRDVTKLKQKRNGNYEKIDER